MKVAVIGLGSMGKRRIRLIRQYSPDLTIYGVDLNEERCNTAREEYSIETVPSLSEVVGKVDAVFISTSPLSHAKIIGECLQARLHVFTELNLVADGYEENIALAKEKDRVLFLSSTFLYRAEVQYITQAVRESQEPLCYRYHIGQYLPDWHPWETFKDFFVADRRTNGCREIFAIELPWLVNAFGPVKSVKVLRDSMTSLGLEYPDNYLVLLEHESGHKGSLCVDVVSRKAVRHFEVYGEHRYTSWDGTPSGLSDYDCEKKQDEIISLYDKIDKLGGYSSNIIENAYYDEIVCFFDAIAGNNTPRHTFEEDRRILSLIDRIEEGNAD